MKLVIQRVSECTVFSNGNKTADIHNGILVLVGIESEDTEDDIHWLVNKITEMRIFNDSDGKMNLSVTDIDGDIAVVSQFTLHASTKKGNRPSFIKAAKPDIAIPLYEKFISVLESTFGKKIQTGIFGADMKVFLCNDGPVTIIMDSKNKE
jgi:D-tyrosyl-tRNA(Tyr) deacylase